MVRDRVTQKLPSILGYREAGLVRRSGQFFRTMHSSGSSPWRSDGVWHRAGELLSAWTRASESGALQGWYDIYAR